MDDFKVGDIVSRKSYGGDLYFKIVEIIQEQRKEPVYLLRGVMHRLKADSRGSDLQKHDKADAERKVSEEINNAKSRAIAVRSAYRVPFFMRLRMKAGSILHLDGDGQFLDTCLKYYRESRLNATGRQIKESEQPEYIRSMLARYKPDVLVITGHDGISKKSSDMNSISNYRNSQYFIESVKEARNFEPDGGKLCVFAGACQSHYEAIMGAGANFASSPGRVLIGALDPAFVSEKVATTDYRRFVTPAEIARITESGSKGIWGIDTKGHLM